MAMRRRLRELFGLTDTTRLGTGRPSRFAAPLRSSSAPKQEGRGPSSPPVTEDDYPGDFAGRPVIEYAPHDGHLPDPGEVVWAWVPYEEDHRRGKTRPVLVIGRDGGWLLAAPMTSKDHDRDAKQEAEAGRYWMDLGTGPWDPQGRPSEVRLNRIVRINPATVEGRGFRVDQKRFGKITRQILQRS